MVSPAHSASSRIISARQDRLWHLANPVTALRNLWQSRELTIQLTRRQVMQRYKGSYLGLLWSFATPLALLLVYTFVFSVIFQARWPGLTGGGHGEFALILFAGLIAFTIFSETLLASATLMVDHPNYVKKVVFPLEILPLTVLGSALVHSCFSLLILLAGALLIKGFIPWTVVLLPLMALPLLLICAGAGWFFASVGVFVRDVKHLLAVVVQILFFLTPIFYPVAAIPYPYRNLIYLNPLTFVVNHFRRVILFGQLPDWGEFAAVTLLAGLLAWLGYIWFMKSKKTFADVI